jgi:hypothetical protein
MRQVNELLVELRVFLLETVDEMLVSGSKDDLRKN